MNNKLKFKANKHIRYDITGSEDDIRAFIIPYQTGVPDMKKVLVLTETSLYIWDMITAGSTLEEICTGLHTKYKQDMTVIQKDTNTFIESLIEKNYIYLG